MGIIADAVAQARESISRGRQATEEKGAIPIRGRSFRSGIPSGLRV